MSVQVYIVEDNERMRRLLCDWIETFNKDFSVCGSAGTAEEALEALRDLKADAVLVDLSLPRMSGIEFVRAAQQQCPGLPCLILSGHVGSQYVRQALDAGARGYLLKDEPGEIVGAIGRILAGERYLSPSLRGTAAAGDLDE